MNRLSRIFHIAVVLYSAMLLLLTMTAFAQSYGLSERTKVEFENLDRRVTTIEALAIDRRLGVIESVLADLKVRAEKGALDYMSSGAIALMLGRTAFEVLKKKSRQAEGE